MQYYRNFNLSNYNSFHLKSMANEIWFPESILELVSLLKYKPFHILSYGTNILLAPYINKIICLRKMPKNLSFNKNLVFVSANVSTNIFAKKVINHNYSGTEGLLGIPGSIGAAIIGNSGSRKYCISDYLQLVHSINSKGKIIVFTKKDLKFNRRYSILQDKDYILFCALFKFNKLNPDKTIIEQTLEYRKNFPKGYSAGGLFKNWYALKPYEKEIRKIESSNLYISSMLNVLINRGNATYEEVLDFINQVKKIVKEPLELEIKIIK